MNLGINPWLIEVEDLGDGGCCAAQPHLSPRSYIEDGHLGDLDDLDDLSSTPQRKKEDRYIGQGAPASRRRQLPLLTE
jgi:hypothetical protein